MRVFSIAAYALMACAASIAPAAAGGTPSSAVLPRPKLNPGYHHPDVTGFRSGPAHAAILRGMAAGTITTLPSWAHAFSVAGKSYSYILLGTDPAAGAAKTIIPTVIVPIRLTIPDYLVHGQPLVLDGSQVVSHMLHSPIFHGSDYVSGHNLQFTDAMLHAEFPHAPSGWHLVLSPSVAPVIDVTTTPGKVDIYTAKTGKLAAVLRDHSVDDAIMKALKAHFSPTTYVIFVTYNALEGGAFGYHDGILNQAGTALQVFTYTSWLEGVSDVFGLPSPDSDTLAHETAETVHDPFSTSLTLKWGDWFNQNKCFQHFIEVGDAVEDAPPRVQNTKQFVTIGGEPRKFTVQSEALLPYFTRESPSSALNGAYSFPNAAAISGPAPLTCIP